MNYVIVQRVWVQTSSDYNTELCTRTLVVPPTMTVAQIMEWSKAGHVLGKGDVVITETDETVHKGVSDE